jgi:hypothetical protein
VRPIAWPLFAAILLAGCASSPGSPSTPDAASPQAGGVEPGGGGAPSAKFLGAHVAHDYAATRDETQAFAIPAGAGPLNVRVFFENPQGHGACAGVISLTVKTPSGETYVSHQREGAASSSSSDTCETILDQKGRTLEPGEWTVVFSGSGAGTGVVDVTPGA